MAISTSREPGTTRGPIGMDTDQPGAASGPPNPPPAKDAAAPGSVPSDAEAAANKKKKKKKDKVRSAWISFAGRIVAQILGAAATVILGIYVVSNYKAGSDRGAASSARVTREARPNAGEPSVAVLPFDNFSGDPSQEYFVDGITEALIADLARTRGLRVISRTSSMYYKGQKKSVPEIAAELGVALLVEGSVARSGSRVRVTAQLIDGARDEHIWARTYDHTVDDVLALQSQIATAIAGEVRGVVPGASRQSASRRAVDPALYDLYLRGRHAWNKRTPEGMQEALARSLLEIGQPREVIAFLAEPAASSPEDLVTLAIAASRTGDPARAKAIVTDLSLRQPVPAGSLARWYAASGDSDRALALLEQVAKQTPRALPQITNDPNFDRIRSSARFKRLAATAPAG
jgi:TolB-like protein